MEYNFSKSRCNSNSFEARKRRRFITQHFWGYSAISAKQTGEYHVVHPGWDIYSVSDYNIDCDFGALYGKLFGYLANVKPDSVFMAEGSAISIFQKKVI